MRVRSILTPLALSLAVGACGGSPTEPSPAAAEYVIDVVGQTFVMRATDPETRRLAEENFRDRNRMFPAGPVLPGNGGFNAPWSWHFDPARVRFVEAAIEVCDGRPTDVEKDRAAYATYCPWGARVVAIRAPER